MTSKTRRTLHTTLMCLVIMVAGVAGGYTYATEIEDSEATETTEQAIQGERERVLSMTQEVCSAASELKSAYTGAVIGHSERCREVFDAGESGQWTALLGEICMDIRKAARTAHLPDTDCPRVEAGERSEVPAEDKTAGAKY